MLRTAKFKISTKLAELLIGLLTWVIAVAIISPSILPQSVQLELGQPSTLDIIAPRTIVDRLTTDALQKNAMDVVPIIWEVSTSVQTEAMTQLNLLLTLILESNNLPNTETRTAYQYFNEKLPVTYQFLDQGQKEALLSLTEEQLTVELGIVSAVLTNIYERGVKDADLLQAKNQGMTMLTEQLPNSWRLSLWFSILETGLKVNVQPNLTATERARDIAKNKVESVMILKGQSILRTGQLVTEHHLTLLNDLGMLDSTLDWTTVVSSAGLVLLLLLIFVIYLYFNDKAVLEQPHLLLAISLVILTTLIIGRGIITVLPSVLIPVAAAVLILAVLFNGHLALSAGVLLSVLAGVLANFDIQSFLTFLVTSWVAVLGADQIHQRTELIKKGAWIGVTGIGTIAIVTIINSGFTQALFSQSMWGGLLGLMTGVLAVGVLPFLEMGFHILTPLKLLELANPNHPLMKRLLMEAPGTYQHSMMVANLAEGAAETIGADALLVRAGAFFHDVGKIKRPMYFTENQTQWGNPHEGIPPQLSANIIISHVKEGLELAREYQLPQEITEFIATHQGTLRAGHFYNLAKEQNGEEPVNQDDFTYPGPIPISKEASILMLADCSEAAVRSMLEPTQEKITEMVAKLVRSRVSNGQLDHSTLSMSEITAVESNLVKRLTSMYHKRVQYRATPEQMMRDAETKQK
jgi:hypothetical protein